MKFETFKELIEALQYQTDVERELHNMMKRLDSDNYMFSLVSEKLDSAIHRVLYDEFDKDTLSWWLYEGVDKLIYSSETHEVIHDLTDIRDLWEYLNSEEAK